MFGNLFGKQNYASEVQAELENELGTVNGRLIAGSPGGRQIISSYERDGTPADKAAAYIIAKVKFSPKTPDEESIRDNLASEFNVRGLDFMSLDPELHYALLSEAITCKNAARTAEMFFEIVEEVGQTEKTDEDRMRSIIEVYREGSNEMFGRSKPKTLLDAFIETVYGKQPPAKSAKLSDAIALAYDNLLSQMVSESEVSAHAAALFSGLIPYSTHDLALSTALFFFKKEELKEELDGAQFNARMVLLEWLSEGKNIARPLASSFEKTLYKIFGTTGDDDGSDAPAAPPSHDRDLESKFAAFKKHNAGKTLHDAAKVVRDFMIWQHTFAEFDKPDDPTDTQNDHARRIERAFLIGAAGTAAEGFSLPHADENIFLMNVVGMYRGLGFGDAEDELAQMFEASDAEEKATRIGGAVMTDYLANGKADENVVHLAALQKECWD
jgi:hypothetical protein